MLRSVCAVIFPFTQHGLELDGGAAGGLEEELLMSVCVFYRLRLRLEGAISQNWQPAKANMLVLEPSSVSQFTAAENKDRHLQVEEGGGGGGVRQLHLRGSSRGERRVRTEPSQENHLYCLSLT